MFFSDYASITGSMAVACEICNALALGSHAIFVPRYVCNTHTYDAGSARKPMLGPVPPWVNEELDVLGFSLVKLLFLLREQPIKFMFALKSNPHIFPGQTKASSDNSTYIEFSSILLNFESFSNCTISHLATRLH